MFIGHFAPAFIAAASYSRGPKLATYFIAAQLIDWAFFALALIGVEKMRIEEGATEMVPFDLYYFPFSHSLFATLLWGAGFGVIVAIWHKDSLAGFLTATVVASHWVLDWVSHRPDLTIAGGEHTYGLGLWNYPELAMPFEIILTLGAIYYYLSKSRGPIAQPLVLVLALLGFQAINWFVPHPEQAGPFLYLQAMVAFGVLTFLANWVGENRYFMQRGGLAANSL